MAVIERWSARFHRIFLQALKLASSPVPLFCVCVRAGKSGSHGALGLLLGFVPWSTLPSFTFTFNGINHGGGGGGGG